MKCKLKENNDKYALPWIPMRTLMGTLKTNQAMHLQTSKSQNQSRPAPK